MELRQLRYVIAVAEELHVGRAAAREHITPSALSQQIARLERELGVTLFERTPRRVTPTAAGAAFTAEAARSCAVPGRRRRRPGRPRRSSAAGCSSASPRTAPDR